MYLQFLQAELERRAYKHDLDKFDDDQFPLFAECAPKLSECEYNSKKYQEYLLELAPALKKQYSNSRHHPEYFQEGIKGMNLIDLLEMICDWYASTKRQKNGNIWKSIEVNQERFGYSDDVKKILKNTVMFLIQIEHIKESESLLRYMGREI